ncbi:MAG: hypothetical protein JNK26_01795 [Candidatus Doudnabacteria bacterium]|nr:hypothetical protein [Candidatus Doudnabacteria bacterium]
MDLSRRNFLKLSVVAGAQPFLSPLLIALAEGVKSPDIQQQQEAERRLNLINAGIMYGQNQEFDVEVNNAFGQSKKLFETLVGYVTKLDHSFLDSGGEFEGMLTREDVGLLFKGFMVGMWGMSEKQAEEFLKDSLNFVSRDEIVDTCGSAAGACATGAEGEYLDKDNWLQSTFHELAHRFMDNAMSELNGFPMGGCRRVFKEGEFFTLANRASLIVGEKEEGKGVGVYVYSLIIMLEARAELINNLSLGVFTKSKYKFPWIAYIGEDWNIGRHLRLLHSLSETGKVDARKELFRAWGEGDYLAVAQIIGENLNLDYLEVTNSPTNLSNKATVLAGNEPLQEGLDPEFPSFFTAEQRVGMAFLMQISAQARKVRAGMALRESQQWVLPSDGIYASRPVLDNPGGVDLDSIISGRDSGQSLDIKYVPFYGNRSGGKDTWETTKGYLVSGKEGIRDLAAPAFAAIESGDYSEVNADPYKYAALFLFAMLGSTVGTVDVDVMTTYYPKLESFLRQMTADTSFLGKDTLMGFPLAGMNYNIDTSKPWLLNLLESFIRYSVEQPARKNELASLTWANDDARPGYQIFPGSFSLDSAEENTIYRRDFVIELAISSDRQSCETKSIKTSSFGDSAPRLLSRLMLYIYLKGIRGRVVDFTEIDVRDDKLAQPNNGQVDWNKIAEYLSVPPFYTSDAFALPSMLFESCVNYDPAGFYYRIAEIFQQAADPDGFQGAVGRNLEGQSLFDYVRCFADFLNSFFYKADNFNADLLIDGKLIYQILSERQGDDLVSYLSEIAEELDDLYIYGLDTPTTRRFTLSVGAG